MHQPPTILCPYHGNRPAAPDSAGSPQCSACLAATLDQPIPPMTPFHPTAPRIAPTSLSSSSSLSSSLSPITFTLTPPQTLLATLPSNLITADDLFPLLPAQIAALEAFLLAQSLTPLGPLVLLYDHPNPADFARFHFSAAYPIEPGGNRCAKYPTIILRSTPISRSQDAFRPVLPPLSNPIFELLELPPLQVASITFTGPWAELYRAYPPLRKAIEVAGIPFGRLTLERYVVPGGTHDGTSVTVVERELAP